MSLLFGFKIFNLSYTLLAILIMFFIAILFTALRTAIASKLIDMQGFQLLMNLLVMPMFFLSGALFSLEGFLKVLWI